MRSGSRALLGPEHLRVSSLGLHHAFKRIFFFSKKDEIGLVLHEHILYCFVLFFLAHFIWGEEVCAVLGLQRTSALKQFTEINVVLFFKKQVCRLCVIKLLSVL